MKKLTLSTLALVALIAVSQAQTISPTPSNSHLVALTQRQGGGRRGGFMFGGAGNDNMLLRRQDVQSDLKLTDAQVQKIKTAQSTLFQSFRGGQGGGTSRQAAFKTFTSTIDGILSASQKTRLHQISIQLAGPMAAMMPDVKKAIGLTADQSTKIKALQQTEGKANRALFQKMRDGDMDRQAAMDGLKKNRDYLKTAISKVLTAEQLTQLKSLGGAPFTSTDTSNFPG